MGPHLESVKPGGSSWPADQGPLPAPPDAVSARLLNLATASENATSSIVSAINPRQVRENITQLAQHPGLPLIQHRIGPEGELLPQPDEIVSMFSMLAENEEDPPLPGRPV